MTLTFVLILVLMFYCTSGIRAMSIQNESDHAQLDELRQTVADYKLVQLTSHFHLGEVYLVQTCLTSLIKFGSVLHMC
jgi:hypothetical protein